MFDLVLTVEADDLDEVHALRDFILKAVAEEGQYLITDVEVYEG